MAVNAEDEQGARAVLVHTLAEQQAAQLHERGLVDLLTDIELPLVHVLRECEKQGIKLDTAKLETVASPHPHPGRPARARDLGGRRRGVRDRLARSSSARSCSRSSACRASAAARPASAPTRACSRRSATSTRSSPRSSASGSSRSSSRPTSTRSRNWIGDDGRLHTTFLQVNAATGRLASINPNLQNIPIRTETGREIRGCFIAEPGNCLISVDYSQVELRILAHIADEQVLRDIFLRGEDVHTETAAAVFDTAPENLTVGMRSKAKMVNYGIVYGLSAYGLADRLQIEQDEAQEFIDRYLERFPAVARFMADAVTQAEEHGYVSTLFGRRRQIPEIRARNWQTRKLGERLAVNSVIQGTAADIIKVAMVRSHDALRDAGLQTRCILQIHDELLFEGPIEEAEQATEIARREMVGAAEMDPPLAVESGVGPNWLDAK